MEGAGGKQAGTSKSTSLFPHASFYIPLQMLAHAAELHVIVALQTHTGHSTQHPAIP